LREAVIGRRATRRAVEPGQIANRFNEQAFAADFLPIPASGGR